MMLPPDLAARLAERPARWLVTGAAGFIGSNLVEALLAAGQEVVGLDNFATGHRRNLDEVRALLPQSAGRLAFIEGDIRDAQTCREAVHGCDFVLHQAALGSVPRSIADPLATNAANVTGFLNMLVAAQEAGVARFVYAASSSTYGDHTALPKREDVIGKPLSPYAVTKLVNELYADVFARTYGFRTIGLRYFNVFGPRQDPDGAYAAVIPKWTGALLKGETVWINGDGETSRDFCHVANAVQANLRAALAPEASAGRVYNVALGDRTTLNELFAAILAALEGCGIRIEAQPSYRDFRAGDVRHSQADIARAETLLGYRPTHRLREGLAQAMPWYCRLHGATPAAAAAEG